MEQKHRSEFPEKELWDLTALYQDREDFLRAIEKAREDINHLAVTIRVIFILLRILKRPLRNWNKSTFRWAILATMALCRRRQTIAMTNLPTFAQAGMEFETDASVALTFFDDALMVADEEVLDRLGKLPHLTAAIRQAKIKKPTI